MNYFLTDNEIQRLFKLIKAYADGARVTYGHLLLSGLSSDIQNFFNSITTTEYKTAISSPQQGVYGSISKFDDTLCIMPYGLGYNMNEVLDALWLISQPGSNFYGISTPLNYTMGRMYAMIHYALQNTLLTEPMITKLSIIGHSYGGVISQVLGVLMQKLILYHSGTMSAAGKANMDLLYDNYLVPSINGFISGNNSNPIINELNERMILNTGSSFGDNIKSIDKQIFGNLTLDMCVGMGVINCLDTSIINDPDLGLSASITAFESGNKIAGDFFSKIYCIGTIFDPFFNVLDPRTPTGVFARLSNNFQNRIIMGQIVMPYQNNWWDPKFHDFDNYVSVLYYNYSNSINLPVYDYNTAPKTNPFPLTKITVFGVSRSFSIASIASLATGFVSIFIGIVPEIIIPGFLIYLGVRYVLFTFWQINI